MITVESQLHGYQHGHQLLAASIQLDKIDQSVIERLSDMAGPLRSGEVFEPYLSAYPLPSGKYYVLARTWQDLTVRRAGCVRTLSLLIPIDSWSNALSLEPFLTLLTPNEFPSEAKTHIVPIPEARELAPAPNFRGGELLEALFFEDAKPVVVLGAPIPELISVRILTALWPSMRRRFSVSAFALSPRRIGGRDFSLIFAPKNAKSKFADWLGRRIDGGAGNADRHRWTGTIVDRVFKEPIPRLLSESEIQLVGTQDSDTVAALRIALLWDELLIKLEHTPSAALGLLDIANSRGALDPNVYLPLKSALTGAAQLAVASLPASEAWPLLGALARKMHGTPLETEKRSVAKAAGQLALTSPEGAVALLNQSDTQGAFEELLSNIAQGLRNQTKSPIENVLMHANPPILLGLLASDSKLAEVAVRSPQVILQLSNLLETLSADEFSNAKNILLPLLKEDEQLGLARVIISTLDEDELLAEVRWLMMSDGGYSKSFIDPVIFRASQINVVEKLRLVLLKLSDMPGFDEFMYATLTPSREDVIWLLRQDTLAREKVQSWLTSLLRVSSDQQFKSMMECDEIAEGVVYSLPGIATDILFRAVRESMFTLPLYMSAVQRLLLELSEIEKVDLARCSLRKLLRTQDTNGLSLLLIQLLNTIGDQLDGAWVVQHGIAGELSGVILNRNLIVINKASVVVRNKLVESIDFLAGYLENRYELDIKSEGADALVQLLNSAERFYRVAFVSASARLLPLLFRSKQHSISAVITVTFPVVYHELAEHDDVPDIVKFLPFFDWDRCKAARHELVDAFSNSAVWSPYDLMLITCLCADGDRVLARLTKSERGRKLIGEMLDEVSNLPVQMRGKAERLLSNFRL